MQTLLQRLESLTGPDREVPDELPKLAEMGLSKRVLAAALDEAKKHERIESEYMSELKNGTEVAIVKERGGV